MIDKKENARDVGSDTGVKVQNNMPQSYGITSIPTSELMQGIGAKPKKAKNQALHYTASPHDEILEGLLAQIKPVNFRALAASKDRRFDATNAAHDPKATLQRKHYHIIIIEQVLEIAHKNDWSLCIHHDFIYLYNGAFWKVLERATLLTFLEKAALKMGSNYFDAKDFRFKDNLLLQFLSLANLPKPTTPKNTVLFNALNGTFEITPQKQALRKPDKSDFLTYQLPFEYDPTATAPMFHKFLQRVLPDAECQKLLAEYLGYVFVKKSVLKLEKVLLLYGNGANGKSVFFEITNALLGRENVSSYSLQSLTETNGYYRASLANVLVNYASELSGKLETQYFKALASGEPIEARLPYGNPFTIEDYAKLIFNCNELPSEVEHTHAFFRRFIIIPFDVTIPENEQDKELSTKIIDNELSGVFNWVIDGLRRLLEQKKFTESTKVKEQLEQFKKQSDNVQMFMEDENWKTSLSVTHSLKEIYSEFTMFCRDNGNIPLSRNKFGKRLEKVGIQTKRTNIGQVVYMERATF